MIQDVDVEIILLEVGVESLAVDDPAKGLVQALHKLISGLRDEIGTPFGFDEQPEFFDGIEIRRVRGQKDRLTLSPLDGLSFVPGRRVQGVTNEISRRGRHGSGLLINVAPLPRAMSTNHST